MALKLDPARESWMSATETRAVLAALQHDGGDARFVGGAVRNAILGREISDVDIATPLVPIEVMRRLETAGIKAVGTGADHGTVTAIVGVRSFEVTTLRRDVTTDGRRAIVQFSTDWKEDAARRDFTMNALYASAEGEILDYFGGAADAKTGRVRFIGDASQRIREDYLRILRLFRFHAWYGKGDIDADALMATAAAKAGIANLSGERLRSEMLKLLAADSPAAVLRIMAAASILSEVLPGALMIPRLERLAAIDAEAFFAPDALLRLAALLPSDSSRVATVAERWQLSNAECRRLEEIAETKAKIVSYLSVREVHKLLYRLGVRRFKDMVFLRWAEDPKPSSAIGWRALLAQAESWQRPKFPLTGRDVMLAGVREGPLVGEILAEVEEWWVDADFTDDAFSLAERLKAVVQGKGV
jgi:poly(A) polymerase